MEFAEHFCLKGRESFTIDPKINPGDARFYFGRHDIGGRLKEQLRRSFIDPGVAKMIVYGAFGSGKTQTLFHLQHHLHSGAVSTCRLEPRTVDLELEMRSKSDCSHAHLQLLEALGMEEVSAWVRARFQKVADLQQELRDVFGDANTALAANNLREAGPRSLQAWRWLTAQSLTNAELQALGLTRNLGQTGSGDLARVLVGLGRLAERNGFTLLFFIDEAEQLDNVSNADSIESIHDYIRKLADSANSTVGFVIGVRGTTVDDVPQRTLARPDIRNRIGEHNYVEIPFMAAVETVRTFVSELLAELVDQQEAEARIQQDRLATTLGTYPFDDDAFTLFCQYASEDPIKALPRNIIRALNECAIQAWDEGKGIIDTDVVNSVAPLVFG